MSLLTCLFSSIPVLRQLGAQERKMLLDDDFLSIAKVWVALETRQFINASIQDVSICFFYLIYLLTTLIDSQPCQVRLALS